VASATRAPRAWTAVVPQLRPSNTRYPAKLAAVGWALSPLHESLPPHLLTFELVGRLTDTAGGPSRTPSLFARRITGHHGDHAMTCGHLDE